MSRLAVVILLLVGCAASPANRAAYSLEFSYQPAWRINGKLAGRVSEVGHVHVEAWRPSDGRRFAFEKQLRPDEIGVLRQAIDAHIEEMGRTAAVLELVVDADLLTINVERAGEMQLSLRVGNPCEDARETALWNQLMRVVSTPDYDTRDHQFTCR